MTISWVLVADTNSARVFTAETPASALVEHDDLTHPEARLHARDVTSDLPGRQHDGNTSGHHAVEGKTDPHKQAVIDFAREVADFLRSNLVANHFAALVLVCEPSFLGVLRHELDDQVKKHVTLEVTKNLVKQSAAEIRTHLPKHLPMHG